MQSKIEVASYKFIGKINFILLDIKIIKVLKNNLHLRNNFLKFIYFSLYFLLLNVNRLVLNIKIEKIICI